MPRGRSTTVSGGARIDGLSRVIRELKEAGIDMADLKAAMQKISADAAIEMKSHIPKRSGKLAASVRASKSANRAVVSVGSARVQYAAPINYGWPKRNIEAANFIDATDQAMREPAVREIEHVIEKLLLRRGLS